MIMDFFTFLLLVFLFTARHIICSTGYPCIRLQHPSSHTSTMSRTYGSPMRPVLQYNLVNYYRDLDIHDIKGVILT